MKASATVLAISRELACLDKKKNRMKATGERQKAYAKKSGAYSKIDFKAAELFYQHKSNALSA